MKFNLPYIFLLHLAVTKDIKTASADNLRTLEAEEPTLTHPSDGLTIISTGAEPSTTTDVLERRINELEAQLTELAQQVVGAPAGLADLADNVVGVSSRGLKKGKGKGKGKSCYDRDGELKLNWIGVYGDKYSNGLVTLNQNGEPMGLPSFKIGPFGNDGPYPTVSITEGPPGTNSYESTYGNPLNPVHKPLMQEFNGLLTGVDELDPGTWVYKPLVIGPDCEVQRVLAHYQENGYSCKAEDREGFGDTCNTALFTFSMNRIG